MPSIDLNQDIIEPDTDFVKPETLYSTYPYKTIGRAFFLYQGKPASCSASSTGNNAVLTAGHCVFLGDFHEKFIFIPQYNNKTTPVGQFVGKKLMALQEWREGNFGRDIAFVICEKQRNLTVEQIVGKLNFGPCDVKDIVRSFGYPGIPEEFGKGEKLIQSISDIQRRFPFSPWEPAPIGFRSKQGPGSSGGPLIKNFKNSITTGVNENIACSVNSFAVRFTYYVFGPFIDDAILKFRQTAVEEN